MMVRACARILHQGRRLYWRIVRPLTLGVSAIALDREGRILLVKNSYRDGWHLPGGGVKRGESVEQAVRRELLEEIAYRSSEENPEILGVYSNFSDRNYDHVIVFVFRSGQADAHRADSFEIESVQAFDAQQLPPDLGAGSARRIQEFLGLTAKTRDW